MSKSTQQLEAILFVSGRSLSLNELSAILSLSSDEIIAAVAELKNELKGRAIHLLQSGDQVELITNPALADIVEPFVAKERERPLSPASLETLAIILYQQPITKAKIDSIRGIASDQSINNLLQRGLVIEAGKGREAGRPMQYQSSPLALRELGIAHPSELPALEGETDAN